MLPEMKSEIKTQNVQELPKIFCHYFRGRNKINLPAYT